MDAAVLYCGSSINESPLTVTGIGGWFVARTTRCVPESAFPVLTETVVPAIWLSFVTQGLVPWLAVIVPETGCVEPDPSMRRDPLVVRERGDVCPFVYAGAAVVTAPCSNGPFWAAVVDPCANSSTGLMVVPAALAISVVNSVAIVRTGNCASKSAI